jgi:Leucine-rich repeat (LRR) protein
MGQLRNLEVYSDTLTALPAEIASLTQLTALQIHAPLTALPDLSALPLKMLSISGTELTALPSWICKTPTLKYLLFSYNNHVTVIPECVNSIQSLSLLWSYENPVASLQPAGVSVLPRNLNELGCVNAELSDVPSPLPSPLNYVDFSGNSISSINLLFNPNLLHLDIADNSFSSLSSYIPQRSPIQFLNASGNPLNSVEDLSYVSDLATLDLSRTGLRFKPLDNLWLLSSLTSLSLADNSLGSVPAGIRLLTGLEELDLGGNSLTAVSLYQSGNGLASLSSLSLANNMFTYTSCT